MADVKHDLKIPHIGLWVQVHQGGGTQFKNYPDQNTQDQNLEDYCVELLKKDCELYCKYLAIVNRVKNDKHNEDITNAKQQKKYEVVDMHDINQRIVVDIEDVYDVLKDEFQQDEELMEHVVSPREAKAHMTTKQQWSKCMFVMKILSLSCNIILTNSFLFQTKNILIILSIGIKPLTK